VGADDANAAGDDVGGEGLEAGGAGIAEEEELAMLSGEGECGGEDGRVPGDVVDDVGSVTGCCTDGGEGVSGGGVEGEGGAVTGGELQAEGGVVDGDDLGGAEQAGVLDDELAEETEANDDDGVAHDVLGCTDAVLNDFTEAHPGGLFV